VRVLVVDNYDSFTFNLVQYLGELGVEPVVFRNDEVTVGEVADDPPEGIVISPGPGRPEAAGVSVTLIRELGPEIPTLGVCLGHQAIVAAFGGSIEAAPEPRHGKTSQINHDGLGVFAGLPDPLLATRYHSLAAVHLPDELMATAHSEDGVVQGVRHRDHPIEGVQFHPESVMTLHGKELLANFLNGC
jgi:anthranilate synthase component 2